MFDRFAICAGYYLFASLHHEGQGSATYAIFGRLARMGFRPSPLLTLETADEGTVDVFNALVERHYGITLP